MSSDSPETPVSSDQGSGEGVQAPDGSTLGYYVGGPYHDGTFSVCETATARMVRVFRGEADLQGPQLYKWSRVGFERFRRMAAGPDDADADAAVHQEAPEPNGPEADDGIREALARLVKVLSKDAYGHIHIEPRADWIEFSKAMEAARAALAGRMKP